MLAPKSDVKYQTLMTVKLQYYYDIQILLFLAVFACVIKFNAVCIIKMYLVLIARINRSRAVTFSTKYTCRKDGFSHHFRMVELSHHDGG